MAILAITSCSADPSPAPASGEPAPIYFFDGHALLPEYHQLTSTDPVAALMEELEGGPDDGLTNFVGEGSFVGSSEREGLEQISIELSDDFWERPAGEIYAAAAQIVFTIATVEEGKEVLLLNGTIPGEVLDGSSEVVPQPFTRGAFEDVRPWVQISQPVAGASVGATFPVSLLLREGHAEVTLVADGEELAAIEMRTGSQRLNVSAGKGGAVELVVLVADRSGGRHEVRLPLELLIP